MGNGKNQYRDLAQLNLWESCEIESTHRSNSCGRLCEKTYSLFNLRNVSRHHRPHPSNLGPFNYCQDHAYLRRVFKIIHTTLFLWFLFLAMLIWGIGTDSKVYVPFHKTFPVCSFLPRNSRLEHTYRRYNQEDGPGWREDGYLGSADMQCLEKWVGGSAASECAAWFCWHATLWKVSGLICR
jgi:hypothetical protein